MAMRLILLLFSERLLRYMDKKIKTSDELASTNDNEPP